MQYVFFNLISQLQPTGLATVQKLRATEGEADVCHRGDGRLRTGVRATWSKKWVQESEGIKDRQCSNQGASFEKNKKTKGASVSCDCALACMHTPCVVLVLVCVWEPACCCRDAGMRENFVFFQTKTGKLLLSLRMCSKICMGSWKLPLWHLQ